VSLDDAGTHRAVQEAQLVAQIADGIIEEPMRELYRRYGHADLAHPQAADWVLGALGPDEAVGFQLHLRGCPHCRAAVAEFGQLGHLLRHLPPAAEPAPGLEARTIASVLAAAAAAGTGSPRSPASCPLLPESRRYV